MRTLVAYHEAGHAILSSAINDAPRYVSIRGDDETLGRSAQKMLSRPTVLAQVYLAGFAAEHLLTGRRPRQLDREVGFALLTLDDPDLAAAFAGFAERDGYRAVHAVLRTGLLDDDQIASEIERLYAAARESLVAVWPAVRAAANALLEREELDGDELFEAIVGIELFAPVFAVQEAHGLRFDIASGDLPRAPSP
jgi:ATP-dependent Zn protease